MKKKCFKLIAVVMTVVMVLSTPLQACAAGQKTYISDIMVAYADTSLSAAKKLLKNNGYTPWSKDVNEGGGNGKYVCIGYKTTTNPDEAITDMAIMNMNGGYSFEDYEQVLEEYQETADKLVDELSTAVSEYRANYEAGKTNAVIAHELLNLYYDEDFGETDNKLGDILASETTTREQLSVILMEASSLAVASIETMLGLACSDNWIDRLLATEKGVKYTTEDDDNARTIYKSMAAFQEAISSYDEIYNASGLTQESSEEEWKKYYETLTQEQQEIVGNYASTRDYLKSTAYGDGTLYDFFMQDLKELDNADLYPLARAMTPGQIATVPYASLANAVQYAMTSEDTMETWLKNIQEDTSLTPVDVFDGVDRSIFTSDGIALTNEALRQCTSTSDYSWYKGGISAEAEKTYLTIIGASAAVASAGAFLAYFAWSKISAITTLSYQSAFAGFSLTNAGSIVLNAAEYAGLKGKNFLMLDTGNTSAAAARANAIADGANSAWSSVFSVTKIITAVAIAVVLVTIIIYLHKKYETYHQNVDYTDIPRIMVDQKTEDDGTRKYVYYYAAKDTKGDYADLNGWSGAQWNALYYTKDSSAGDPILTEAIFQNTNTVSDSSYNLALHAFGTTAAYNLNRYAVNQSEIYAFFKTEDRSTLTGTAVSYGAYGIVGACGAIVGAAIMFAVNKVTAKKRRWKEKTV